MFATARTPSVPSRSASATRYAAKESPSPPRVGGFIATSHSRARASSSGPVTPTVRFCAARMNWRLSRATTAAMPAARSSPAQTLRRLDALLACRTALETNVAPLLAMEALMLGLAQP